MSKAIVVIPARLASTRLPNKPLLEIAGKPMLWHVYQRCTQASKIAAVHVATDSQVIVDLVKSWGGKAWLTDENCNSGTERIATIASKLDAQYIINVQGDEPLLEPQIIDDIVDAFANTSPTPHIVTPACKIKAEDIFNPNVVKMIIRHDGYALYFSRQPIPYIRDIAAQELWGQEFVFLGHLGIYGYSKELLLNYHHLPPSPLEQAERLEQLRFLQAGIGIFTYPTEYKHFSVDTPQDLEKIRAIFVTKDMT
jgi:3-deoxy-manno-octulosonate cytidylyltransferase (CMP-KDO synthetase)